MTICFFHSVACYEDTRLGRQIITGSLEPRFSVRRHSKFICNLNRTNVPSQGLESVSLNVTSKVITTSVTEIVSFEDIL